MCVDAYSPYHRQLPTKTTLPHWQNVRKITLRLITPKNQFWYPACRSALEVKNPSRTCSVRLKTFIVEDNPTIRENLIGTLEELADVRIAATADTENEAKAWMAAHPGEWDLAIVDLFLKQGSGLGVLAACRNRTNTQKVVVLSNYATADIRQRCAQLGVDAVFDKSNEIDALVDYCIQQSAVGD